MTKAHETHTKTKRFVLKLKWLITQIKPENNLKIKGKTNIKKTYYLVAYK